MRTLRHDGHWARFVGGAMNTKPYAVRYSNGWTSVMLSLHDSAEEAMAAAQCHRWRPGKTDIVHLAHGYIARRVLDDLIAEGDLAQSGGLHG